MGLRAVKVFDQIKICCLSHLVGNSLQGIFSLPWCKLLVSARDPKAFYQAFSRHLTWDRAGF